jgi:hypothetical protein
MEDLLARSKSLREDATAFNDRLKDMRAKNFMRTMTFNSLDGVDQSSGSSRRSVRKRNAPYTAP